MKSPSEAVRSFRELVRYVLQVSAAFGLFSRSLLLLAREFSKLRRLRCCGGSPFSFFVAVRSDACLRAIKRSISARWCLDCACMRSRNGQLHI